MKKIAIALCVMFSCNGDGCTNEADTRRTLEEAGYTDVAVGGHGWGCHRDDATCTEWSATGPTGRRAHGVVGCSSDGPGCDESTCTIRVKP